MYIIFLPLSLSLYTYRWICVCVRGIDIDIDTIYYIYRLKSTRDSIKVCSFASMAVVRRRVLLEVYVCIQCISPSMYGYICICVGGVIGRDKILVG